MKAWVVLVLLALCFVQHTDAAVKRHSKLINEDDDEPMNLDEDATPASPANDDDAFDDDDFVGQPTNEHKKKPEQKPLQPASVLEPEEPEHYYWEILAIVVILAFAVNFYFGSKANDSLADSWFNSFLPLFQQQFAVLSSNAKDSPPMLKDSQSCYQFYASGRRFCSGMLVTLDLRRRHDLFGLVGAYFDLAPVQDTMTVEIPMDEDAMSAFVFAVVRRKEEKRQRKAIKDLENYGVPLKTDRVPESLSVLSDCPELERELLDDNVVRTLAKCDDLIQLIHFTDEYVAVYPSQEKSKKILRFKYVIPARLEDWERLSRLIKMSIHFIDVVGTTAISAAASSRAKAKRKAVADALFKSTYADRQEALQRKKEEAKQKERDSAAELSPEARKKKEDRDAKKQAKSSKPRVKILR